MISIFMSGQNIENFAYKYLNVHRLEKSVFDKLLDSLFSILWCIWQFYFRVFDFDRNQYFVWISIFSYWNWEKRFTDSCSYKYFFKPNLQLLIIIKYNTNMAWISRWTKLLHERSARIIAKIVKIDRNSIMIGLLIIIGQKSGVKIV